MTSWTPEAVTRGMQWPWPAIAHVAVMPLLLLDWGPVLRYIAIRMGYDLCRHMPNNVLCGEYGIINCCVFGGCPLWAQTTPDQLRREKGEIGFAKCPHVHATIHAPATDEAVAGVDENQPNVSHTGYERSLKHYMAATTRPITCR